MAKYYLLVKPHAAIENDSLIILLEIPLETADRYFELFKLVPVPVNSNFSYNIYVEPPHTFLAISLNKLKYAPMEIEDLY